MFIDSTANGYRVAPLPALQANFALSKASSIRCLHPPRLRYLCWLVSTSIACKIKSIQTAAAPFRIRGLGLRVDPLIHFLLQQVLEEIKRPRISGAISAGSCSFRIAPALSPIQRALTPPHVAFTVWPFVAGRAVVLSRSDARRQPPSFVTAKRRAKASKRIGCPSAAALKATAAFVPRRGSKGQKRPGCRPPLSLSKPRQSPSGVSAAVALFLLSDGRSAE